MAGDVTWLRYVIDGGALVLLAAVLYGAWRIAGQFMDLLHEQVTQVQDGIRVQEQLQVNIKQLVQVVVDHEVRTLGRLDSYQQQVLTWVEEHEEKAAERHKELLRRIPPPTPGRKAG